MYLNVSRTSVSVILQCGISALYKPQLSGLRAVSARVGVVDFRWNFLFFAVKLWDIQ